MISRKRSVFIAIGSLALAAGLNLRLWTHGNASHFGTGFLLGIAIALLVFGVAGRSRGVSS